MLNNATILITGGSGSFGNKFVEMTLKKYNPKNTSPMSSEMQPRTIPAVAIPRPP